jgi:N-acyl-D-aspartate/D-glutamate deacylase
MDLDLVIRDGFVVDGSGRPGRVGDVGIVGDRVVAVGEVDGRGREEIDADGLVVAPGFVDAHTHMDAQVFWDELGSSSCWHGVTTVAMGNCGFSLAPASEAGKGLVVRNLERAEDIAAEAMEQGIRWSWSTFAQYLDTLDGLPKGINYASAIGHSALRTWVMGERAFTEPATDDDLAAMQRELVDALRAGASGFTTSRAGEHTTADDRPVASRLSTWDETAALVATMGREGAGVFEMAGGPGGDGGPEERVAYYDALQELAIDCRVPVVFGLFAMPRFLGAVRAIDATAARGGRMYGLTHCRGASSVQSFQTELSFDVLPEWREVRTQPLDRQRQLLRDPAVRARLVDAVGHGSYGDPLLTKAREPNYEQIEIMESAWRPNTTLAEESRRRGVHPAEVVIDLALERDFDVIFLQMLTPQREDELIPLLRNPNTAMTFSDAGAHVTQICDASIQSYLLAYWVRERQVFTLEEAVRMITHQPAKVWNLHDRGLLAPGYAADVTIFDPDTVAPRVPRLVHDLPGGAPRLVQHADGFVATIVNGEVFTRDGSPTGARSGRLLRANQIPRPPALV